MLQIKDLTIIHTRDLRTILKDFSCTLNAGDKAVMIGEEGNGKSTLLKWIFDPRLIEGYAEAKGRRIINSEKLAYLPQNLSETDEKLSIYGFFCEEPAFSGAGPGELSRLSKSFRLPADIFYSEQLMGSLSGGEKVKLQLARMLLSDPTVLLLDEPSNDIDIPALESIETLINSFRGIVLFISHDETLIEHTANVVIHLEQVHRKQQCRHTVARVPYAKYAKDRLAAFKKQEQMAESDLKEKRIRDEKFRRISQRVEHEQNVITRADPAGGRLLKKKMHAVKSMGRRFEREDEKMTEMPVMEAAIDLTLGEDVTPLPAGKILSELKIDRLEAPDGRLLSKDIRLMMRGRDKICITGANGAGKTTLIRRIAEELLRKKDIRAEYMPQNYSDMLDPDITPIDNICRGGDAELRTKVRSFLGALRFTTAEMEHSTRELSGGQQAKIFLLRMNLSNANVLILDEPTRNLSPLSGPVMRSVLKGFPGAIISVSHDRKYIEEVCSAVYELDETGLHLK